ncbi:MAG: hypothetical protein IKE43_05745 [Coriobacteriales bacterium]|nr:hypothetical protein [Coriobacteriales bacterium]
MTIRLNAELLGKRFVAIILILVTAVAILLSTTAFSRAAYANETIVSAECTVAAPLANANPDYTGVSADPSKYTVTVSKWYMVGGVDSVLYETDVFDPNRYYCVRVTFEPEEGYCFDESTEFTINGEVTISVNSDLEKPMRESSTLIAMGWLIEDAHCTVKAPLAGAHPDFAPVSDEPDFYSVETEQWYAQIDGFPNVAETDTFENGLHYCVRILFKPEPGYYFDDDTMFTINGRMTSLVGMGVIGTRMQEIGGLYAYSRPLGFYVVTVGALNVRSDPWSSSTRIAGLSYGDVVEAVLMQGSWLGLASSADAWVDGDYLALTYSRETAIYPTEYTVTVGTVNVREDISTDSARIGGYKEGDKILVTGVRTDAVGEDWLVLDYVTDGGYHQLGYVMAKYTDAKGTNFDFLFAHIDMPDFFDEINEYLIDPESTEPSIIWDDEITYLPGLPDFPDGFYEYPIDPEFSQPLVVWDGEISALGENYFPVTNGDAVFTVFPGNVTRFSTLHNG